MKIVDPDQEIMEERMILKELARKRALRGDRICGGLLALESYAKEIGLGYEVSRQDWRDVDDEDDIRPY